MKTNPVRQIRLFAVCVALTIATSGCHTTNVKRGKSVLNPFGRINGAPAPSYNPKKAISNLQENHPIDVILNRYYPGPGTNNPRPTLEQRTEWRNELVGSQIALIDMNYELFVNRLTANRQNFDSASDIAEIGVNLATTVAGGAAAKATLGAISTAISGARVSIDKNYFYEKTVPALVTLMNGYRKQVKTRIHVGLKQTDGDYPLTQAISDIRDLYHAGTLVGAIAKLQEDASVKARDADEKLQRVLNASLTGEKLAGLTKHFDVKDEANQKALLPDLKKALRVLNVSDEKMNVGYPELVNILKDLENAQTLKEFMEQITKSQP